VKQFFIVRTMIISASIRRREGRPDLSRAVDNATGCGVLLELARVWAGTKPAPSRSILFAAVTAEEQGLLGSEFLVSIWNNASGADSGLELRCSGADWIPEEVEVSGAERTTFYPEVEKIAKQFGLAIKPDAHPEAGHYYRSDHFSLGRVGIPAFPSAKASNSRATTLPGAKHNPKITSNTATTSLRTPSSNPGILLVTPN